MREWFFEELSLGSGLGLFGFWGHGVFLIVDNKLLVYIKILIKCGYLIFM